MTRSRLFVALLAVLLLATPSARACTSVYQPGETPETPYSEVARAPVIVEARVIRPLQKEQVEFVVMRSLRGDATGHIRVKGQFLRDIGEYRDWLGACLNDVYQAGTTYLLLLTPDGQGGFWPTTSPMQYMAYKERALHRAWVEVAADIIRIEDTLPPDQRIAAIRALLAPLQRAGAGKAEKLKADRLSEQLDTVQATWPTGHLLWLHAELAAGRIPAGLRLTPWVENWTGRLNDGPLVGPSVRGLRDFREAVLWALSRPGRPDAAPFFEALAARDDDPTGLIFAMVHMAWHDRRADAVRLLTARLLTIPVEGEHNHLHLLAGAMSGDGGSGEEPAWHRDPALRDSWPDLAWRIGTYLSPDGRGDAFSDIAAYLPLPDPTADPDKAVWLAKNVDGHPVIGWAEQQLRDPANRAKLDQHPYEWENAAEAPLRVLVGGDQGKALLEELFCLGGTARMAVIKAFGAEGEYLDRGFYPRMLATPGLSAEERDGLLLAAASVVTRRPVTDDDYLAIVKGNPPKAEPLPCP